jgi:uncharacterized membrane protein required for colicin V production
MYLDLLLLFLVGLMGVFGYIHGFVRQVLSLLTLLSIIFFAEPLALWLKNSSEWPWFENAPHLFAWGVSAIFIVVMFLCVGGIVGLIKKESGLSPADRWIGCALGAFKGVILAVSLALLVHMIPEHANSRFSDLRADVEDSVFAKLAKPILTKSSLVTFQALREVKEHMKAPQKNISQSPHLDPWAQSTDLDTE